MTGPPVRGRRGVQRRGQGPLRREDVGGEGLTPPRPRGCGGLPSRRSRWPSGSVRRAEGRLEVRPAGCRTPAHRRHARYRRRRAGRRSGSLGLGKPTRQIARMLGLRDGVRLRVGPGRGSARGRYDGGGGGRRGEGDGRRGTSSRLRSRSRCSGRCSATQKQETMRLSNRRKGLSWARGCAGPWFPLARVLTCLGISKSSFEYARRALARARAAPADGAGRARGQGVRVPWAAAAATARSARAYARAPTASRPRPPRSAGGAPPCARAGCGPGAAGAPRATAPPARSAVVGQPTCPGSGRWRAGRPASPSRPAHDFSAPAPGEPLVTDVTEFSLNGFRAHLSPVIDC